MDKLRTLKVLVAVGDLGTVTAAADHLGVSVATVVRQVEALEAALGVRLVHRTTRSTTPTAEGLRYVQDVRRVIADLQEADDALQAGQASPQGRVHLTAPLALGQLHVVPSVLRFLAAHPRMQVRATLLDRVVHLVDEGFDVAVRVGPLPDSSLIAQQIGTMRQVVVASPAYLQRAGRPDRPEDLMAHDCLRFTGAGASAWTFRDGQRRVDVDPAGRFECNTVPALLAACADGFGIARVQSYQAAPWLADGRLQVVLDAFEPEPHAVSLVYPNALRIASRVRVLVDWLKADLQAALLAAQPQG